MSRILPWGPAEVGVRQAGRESEGVGRGSDGVGRGSDGLGEGEGCDGDDGAAEGRPRACASAAAGVRCGPSPPVPVGLGEAVARGPAAAPGGPAGGDAGWVSGDSG